MASQLAETLSMPDTPTTTMTMVPVAPQVHFHPKPSPTGIIEMVQARGVSSCLGMAVRDNLNCLN